MGKGWREWEGEREDRERVRKDEGRGSGRESMGERGRRGGE